MLKLFEYVGKFKSVFKLKVRLIVWCIYAKSVSFKLHSRYDRKKNMVYILYWICHKLCQLKRFSWDDNAIEKENKSNKLKLLSNNTRERT